MKLQRELSQRAFESPCHSGYLHYIQSTFDPYTN